MASSARAVPHKLWEPARCQRNEALPTALQPPPVPLSDIVAQHLPRCLQVDLPAVLAVDLPHCERAAMQAVAGSSGQLQLLQGELVTQGYFDALAEEVDDLLQVRGTSAAAPVRTLRGCAAAVSLA